MARPIDPNEAHRLQRRKELKYHSIVEWNDVKYTIWQDWRGPIYSTPATPHELRAAGADNTIVMHPNYDSITFKVMADRGGTHAGVWDENRTLNSSAAHIR